MKVETDHLAGTPPQAREALSSGLQGYTNLAGKYGFPWKIGSQWHTPFPGSFDSDSALLSQIIAPFNFLDLTNTVLPPSAREDLHKYWDWGDAEINDLLGGSPGEIPCSRNLGPLGQTNLP
jgi:hypothetical protein